MPSKSSKNQPSTSPSNSSRGSEQRSDSTKSSRPLIRMNHPISISSVLYNPSKPKTTYTCFYNSASIRPSTNSSVEESSWQKNKQDFTFGNWQSDSKRSTRKMLYIGTLNYAIFSCPRGWKWRSVILVWLMKLRTTGRDSLYAEPPTTLPRRWLGRMKTVQLLVMDMKSTSGRWGLCVTPYFTASIHSRLSRNNQFTTRFSLVSTLLTPTRWNKWNNSTSIVWITFQVKS